MASSPLYQEQLDSGARTLVAEFADADRSRPLPEAAAAIGRPGRSLCLYAGPSGYGLQDELDFLTNRALEPNVFFSGRFLAPAMPRLEDRIVRLMLLRDEDERRSRLRFLLPFSVEKPGFAIGPSILRGWSHPFGPLGTPLLDGEEAAETLDNVLAALGDEQLSLPPVLVLPDLRTDGTVTRLIRAVALARNLPIGVAGRVSRPMLDTRQDAGAYLAEALSGHHLRDMRRQWRRLSAHGTLSYRVARQPAEIRHRLEEFLVLEAGGWKGARRSAMVTDRYRAAFAREAISNLAQVDRVRIHTVDLDGGAIASMIVLVVGGDAYTWKTAYDERYGAFSPGKLLTWRLTEWHLDDANIRRTDSCAVPDHPVMTRFFRQRCAMETLVVGLRPDRDRDVRQVTAQLHLYRNTRNMARLLRDKIRARIGRRQP